MSLTSFIFFRDAYLHVCVLYIQDFLVMLSLYTKKDVSQVALFPCLSWGCFDVSVRKSFKHLKLNTQSGRGFYLKEYLSFTLLNLQEAEHRKHA